MSPTTVDLLDRIDHKLPDVLRVTLEWLVEEEEALRKAKERVRQTTAEAQKICEHKIILEQKGGSGYSGRGRRVCYFCGFYELQPMASPGDEYYYATYGSYKILTGSQYAYSPSDGREVYQVDHSEFSKRWRAGD